jgi:hypothetical protein
MTTRHPRAATWLTALAVVLWRTGGDRRLLLDVQVLEHRSADEELPEPVLATNGPADRPSSSSAAAISAVEVVKGRRAQRLRIKPILPVDGATNYATPLRGRGSKAQGA